MKSKSLDDVIDSMNGHRYVSSNEQLQMKANDVIDQDQGVTVDIIAI